MYEMNAGPENGDQHQQAGDEAEVQFHLRLRGLLGLLRLLGIHGQNISMWAKIAKHPNNTSAL
jgi:hypothetical protein